MKHPGLISYSPSSQIKVLKKEGLTFPGKIPVGRSVPIGFLCKTELKLLFPLLLISKYCSESEGKINPKFLTCHSLHKKAFSKR